MSLNLLADAKQEVDRDYKEFGSPSSKAESKACAVSTAGSSGAAAELAESKQSSATAPPEQKMVDGGNEYDDDITSSVSSGATHSSADAQNGIIHKVSEYLFDLFDANCMEDYHTMQKFEEKAWRKFDPEVEEYTFEQQELHKEFCELFERLTEGFITSEGYSVEQFYAEVRDAAAARPARKKDADPAPRPWGEVDEGEDAEEVVDVVYQVVDFRLWADEMRSIARNNRQWQARREMDQEALRAHGSGFNGANG